MRLLFIGNSFTARHKLPQLVSRLAATRDLRLEHDLITVGGASLRRHWNAGTAAARIREGDWDGVVLQEQSTLPIKNPQRTHENIREFHPLIQAAGARTILYETWARQDHPETQITLSRTYQEIAAELKATLIPAGQAWQHTLAQPQPPQLHDRDGSHPTYAGSYLAACCFVATLTGQPALGLPPADLDEEIARRLQLAADHAVASIDPYQSF